jgi:hypothetical protein
MQPLPTVSPFDGGEIIVTRFYCPASDVTVDGRFYVEIPFAALSAEQLQYVEAFIRCEGKLNRLQDELDLSYPTLRSRLHDIIRALGYEPGKEESERMSEEERRRILDDLDKGAIGFEEAMQLLGGTDA